MRDKNTENRQKKSLIVKGRSIDLSTPGVMGIINITPDSFYSPAGKAAGAIPAGEWVLQQAGQMLASGAEFLDLGAYSSRPNAVHISAEEEMGRLLPPLRAIVREFPNAVISVDTFRSEVARAAIIEGASIINDISAGEMDPTMFQTVASLKVPYILMHMKGTPQTMQQLAQYENVFEEVYEYFRKKIIQLKELGVDDVIVDPGFGFAKTVEQNYLLLDKLDRFQDLGVPILAGLSRKSMIYKLLLTNAEGALAGTIAANTIALMKGASVLRVHDVKPAVETIRIVEQLRG